MSSKAAPTKKFEVVQPPEEEVPAKVLATSILEIAEGVKKIRRSGLTERALVLLISDACGVGKPDVRRVLDGLDQLERLYLKK